MNALTQQGKTFQVQLCLVFCVHLCCANFVQTLGTAPHQSHSLDMWDCSLASLLVFKVAVTHFSSALHVILKLWETRSFPLTRKQKATVTAKSCALSFAERVQLSVLFWEKSRTSNEDQYALCLDIKADLTAVGALQRVTASEDKFWRCEVLMINPDVFTISYFTTIK